MLYYVVEDAGVVLFSNGEKSSLLSLSLSLSLFHMHDHNPDELITQSVTATPTGQNIWLIS